MPPKKAAKGAAITATAASDRPRRAAAAPAAAIAPTPKAPETASKKRKATTDKAEPAKKRGRPSKAAKAEDEDAAPKAPAATGSKARGRPKKSAPAVPQGDAPAPRKRGSAPKGGETTKITADDGAAAEQLEDDLVETADAEGDAEPANRKPATPVVVKSKNNAKKTKAAGDGEDGGGVRYWLMKAEQEDRYETTRAGTQVNTKFTIDDLRSRKAPEPWDGVRNVVAAKNMRTMRKGDLAFFYASQGKQGRKPGITGIMEIVSEAEPDPTVGNEASYGYVEKESDRHRWSIVRVEFRKKLVTPVSLKELQSHGGAGGALEHMQLFRQSRLSVSQVSRAEWDFIVENLIEGYE